MAATLQLPTLSGDIVLNEKPAVEAFKATEAEAQKFKQTIKEETDLAAKGMEKYFKESLDHIKEGFGRRSVFGESIELLAGGGVVAGIGVAGVLIVLSGGPAAIKTTPPALTFPP